MKTTILSFAMLAAAVAAYPIEDTPLARSTQAVTDAVRIDGSPWDDNVWYVQVDGVMGGLSTGSMTIMEDSSVMKFTGDISLDGGGFSSVRRSIDLDLSDYAGVVVTLEADVRGLGGATSAPTGLHLQFDDRSSYYDFSAAFTIPLSSGGTDDGPVVTSVYMPVESFDRGSRIGFVCRDDCALNPSRIRGMSVYVLFQEGDFDVRLRSIEAVKEPRSFPLPEYDLLETEDDVIDLIMSTISSGGGLYDKGYIELCIAMYWSVLNTILSSGSEVVSEPIQAVICAGLQEVEAQTDSGDSKANIAWSLRHTFDSVMADMQGTSRTVARDWLPTTSEAALMEVSCLARTSAAPGFMFDPTNQNILVSDINNSVDESITTSNTVAEKPSSDNAAPVTNENVVEVESPSESEEETTSNTASPQLTDETVEESPTDNAIGQEDTLSATEEDSDNPLSGNTVDYGGSTTLSAIDSSELSSSSTRYGVASIVVGTLLLGLAQLV